jgi:hypothetical protein
MTSLVIVIVAGIFLVRFDQGYDANIDGWTPIIMMAGAFVIALIDALRSVMRAGE